jgi:subtilase family serine protease
MRQLPQVSLSPVVSRPGKRLGLVLGRLPRLLAIPVLLLAVAFAGVGLGAQTASQVTRAVDTSQVRALPNHLPLWAKPANNAGLVPADQALDQMTIVLARSPQQEQAFDQFLADQQNPASPNYHHWLTPVEVGQRFGLSDQDIASVTGWLQSQGLHVNWVSPSRIFIGFGGTAADIGRAFQTEMHYYKVNGVQRMSVSSDPMIPQALVPVIKAVRGLYTIEEKPQVHAAPAQSASPQETTAGGSHYLSPADFATVYDIPASLTGAGITIGIVGRSRVNTADLDNFTSKTGIPSITSRLTTVVPPNTTDPGSPLTACSASPCNVPEDQLEATLDVMRAGSTAQGANLLLVVDTSGNGGDIGADAQYLVNASSPPQVMSISFGLCEHSAGQSGVTFWDSLFKSATAEGISVFVSSDDSGASGCDASFTTPPASPLANSPNYICSSSYATCVGGTEFADWSNPSTYWSSSNGTNLSSVRSYIPEGAWNEPLDSNSSPVVASSGGGVSLLVATPSWQTGTGVPGKVGRYTPDIAFSASGHDGYFGCLAAAGTANSSSCVTVSGSFGFEYFSGTSAAAPGMAGITALLDQKLGSAQGNLNPSLYAMAASVPAAFHDVTGATSGVSNCSVNTPSMCNNSIPSATGLSGGQAGFLVTAGYDEVTGLGSLDAGTFISAYAASATKTTPTVTVTPSASTITTAQSLTVTVAVSGGTGGATPTGAVTLTSGSYSSVATALVSGSATITVAVGSLTAGTDTLTAAYTPDSSSSSTYNSATGTASVTVTSSSKTTPTVTVTPSASTLTTAQSLTVTVAVSGGSGSATPTGSVTLTSGSYTSAATTLVSGSATITVAAGSLTAGTDTLTATYTPDSSSSSTYNSATGTKSVTVTSASTTITPTVTVTPSASTITTAQSLTVAVAVSGGSGSATPTGSVTLSSGSYSSTATTLASGTATITVAAGSLATGTDTLTATYTPDASSSSTYGSATGSKTVTVTPPATALTPTVTVTPSAATITDTQSDTVTVAVAGSGSTAPTGTVTLAGGSYSAHQTLASGSASFTIAAGTLSSGATTITATYPGDGTYASATGTATITVSPAAISVPTPSPVAPGSAATGNVTISAGSTYSGTLNLTCSLTTSPSGAQSLPKCSLSPTSVTITAGGSGTTTLTVQTTAASSASLGQPFGQKLWGRGGGGAVLALLLMFGLPARRRRWLLMLVLLGIVAAAGVIGCGGGSSNSSTNNTPVTPATTPGNYVFTVAGVDSANAQITTSTPVTVTVQ